MLGPTDAIITVREDGDFDILARITAFSASGSLSPNEDEGYLLKAADVSSITSKAFNDAGTQLFSGTFTGCNCIVDTLQETGAWKLLVDGGNYRHAVPAAWVATGDSRIWIEDKFTLTGGEVFHLRVEVNIENIFTS